MYHLVRVYKRREKKKFFHNFFAFVICLQVSILVYKVNNYFWNLLFLLCTTIGWDGMGWQWLMWIGQGNTIMDYTMLLSNMVMKTSKNITPIWTSEIFWRFWYGIWYLILTVLLFFFEIWWNANHKQPHWIWIWILTSTKLLKIVKKDKIFLTLSLWTWNPIFPYQKAFLPLLNWTNINDGKHLKVTMF